MNLFITGGSRGVGYHVMMTALAKGYNVAFSYVNPDTDLKSIQEKVQEIAPAQKCQGYQLDVKNSAQVNQVVDQVMDDFEEIDAVINNAGINRNNLAFHMTDEEWQEVLQTNLSGSFYVMRQFLANFLGNGGGRYILISSIAKDGISGQANYAASKAGLIGLSGTFAKEYGSKGITSNVVVPGIFETDMTRQSLSEDLKGFWLKHCPLKRFGALEELSNVVLFLASKEARFINGQVISVTGGLDWAG